MKKIALLVLCLSLSPSSYAGNFNTSQLHEMQKTILQRTTNISQLEQGLIDDNDKQSAFTIHDSGMEINTELGFFVDLGTLYGDMAHAVDKAKVRAMIYVNKDFFKDQCKESINYTTTNLASIKSPALVSEGEKLRNDIIKACDMVKKWE